ncbi:hypothetical protein QAD02_008861 [Eretmocerus hayati]|uniref:Uncharacterized protein n=1 Tax=Eretmocerus hayati TaxID=131215 RepID=A0ACC2N824_9HYME|nr:hypothetical protein QAD02_008861 [Eretmocerus hayati]
MQEPKDAWLVWSRRKEKNRFKWSKKAQQGDESLEAERLVTSLLQKPFTLETRHIDAKCPNKLNIDDFGGKNAPVRNDGAIEDEAVLRIDFSQIFNSIYITFETASERLSGKAKEKLQLYKNIFLELKREIQTDLNDVKEYLQDRLDKAKKDGWKKYEEVKQKVIKIFEAKKEESKEKVDKFHKKVVELLDKEKP